MSLVVELFWTHINYTYANISSMFCSKSSKTGKNDIGSYLAILFCTVVILSTLGYSVGIRNSFAQQELQTQQPSTVTELPWSNNLPYTGNTQHHNIVISSTQTFTNSKNLDVNHAFVSNIESYRSR